MKLVISIIQDNDTSDLIYKLTEAGFRVTKLATTGGFLKAGNTTMLIGVEKEKVDTVIGIIEKTCRTREQIEVSASPITGAAEGYMPYPVKVQVGGATVFVVDVDKFVKL